MSAGRSRDQVLAGDWNGDGRHEPGIYRAQTAAAKPEAKPSPNPSNAVFPNAVSSKYSKESAGKARMHTCLDQYNANKAGNGNGGLEWIMKGGGYYSECNKRLKG